ncbi:unnamed protein product [Effrenium voratum]|uniref:Glycosyl transferase family 25 domain-containing protein n=1 Tax=Effrenium voratum TaxID=2562239 RepID=A0AA36N2V4_9DINO|nr:unnamed protein product [Effrenium voratum]CAJ1431605.1 unnamed protein product [Effrenium voratum]
MGRVAMASSRRTRGTKKAPTARRRALPAALVINLARRKDRWAEIKSRLQRIEGLAFERLEAVDGKEKIEQSEVAAAWNTAGNWRYVTRMFEGGQKCGYTVKDLALTAGERGCAASHVKAWRRCAASRKALLVMEDDARPKRVFAAALGNALQELRGKAAQVLWLGYVRAAPWRRRVPLDHCGLRTVALGCPKAAAGAASESTCGQLHVEFGVPAQAEGLRGGAAVGIASQTME